MTSADPRYPLDVPSLVDALDNLRELHTFVGVSWYGLRSVAGQRSFHEAILRALSTKDLSQADLAANENLTASFPPEDYETFATAQQREGFPYLYQLCTIAVWGILEAAIDGLVADLLTTTAPHKLPDRLRPIRGPIVEYLLAPPPERAAFLMDLIKQEVKASLQLGVGRFETILGALGLGGTVDARARRALLELSQVRNVLVHRAGRTDRRLTKICPWIQADPGSKLIVSPKQFETYTAAAYWYIGEVLRRCIVDRYPTETRLIERALEGSRHWLARLQELMPEQADPSSDA